MSQLAVTIVYSSITQFSNFRGTKFVRHNIIIPVMILLLFVPLAIALIPSKPNICKSLIKHEVVMETQETGESDSPTILYKAGIVNEM